MASVVECPHCKKKAQTKVIESRTAKFDGTFGMRRSRVCLECQKRFRTLEIVDWHGLLFPSASAASSDKAVKNITTGKVYSSARTAGSADGHAAQTVARSARFEMLLSDGSAYRFLERDELKQEWLARQNPSLAPKRQWSLLAGKQLGGSRS